MGDDARAGRGWRLPSGRLRTPAVTRWIEGPIARGVMGVRTYGVSPTGVREWYRATSFYAAVHQGDAHHQWAGAR